MFWTPSLMILSTPSLRLSTAIVCVALMSAASGVAKAGIIPRTPFSSFALSMASLLVRYWIVLDIRPKPKCGRILFNYALVNRSPERLSNCGRAMKVPLKPRLRRFSLRVPRKSQDAPAGKNLFILLVCSYEITGDPTVRWITRFLDDLGRKPHHVPFECRVGMANADFLKPTARADPIG